MCQISPLPLHSFIRTGHLCIYWRKYRFSLWWPPRSHRRIALILLSSRITPASKWCGAPLGTISSSWITSLIG
ncbi:hypothetical protein OE88DRAFT_335971 [Heliocybe sulcata]|uniref:Uncharacterized protein n=1 Tax=Heliocybe sulcata TaxID=5364 RepID=A0A5C3MXE6_9AGAM|nr:hypothetical protein OE88DRAFT_335971 [Heliocybe sulcata]